MKKNRIITIIIACYNEAENIPEIYQRIIKVFRKLQPYRYEIIFVDNASEDNSHKILSTTANKDKSVKVLIMSRNFGSPQPSFLAGLKYAQGDAIILLHGDIQDPPELIPQFVTKWKEGYDVVYGIRTKRAGYNFLWNFFYKGFYFLLKKLSYIRIPLDAGEFSLIDKKVAKELLKFQEFDYYLRCLRAYAGFKQIGIPYVREPRKRGKSSENILTSLWWAKTIIVNFSFKPLEWISYLALTVTFSSFVFLVINIGWYLVNRNAPPGIPTTVILILFLGGVQLLCLGIIAEYLAKIFLEIKKRPKYIVDRTINI